MMMKIDMVKAYDSIDWGFLVHVFSSFGFSTKFCGLIRQCIMTQWFYVTLNSISKGFFKSGHGLR